MAKPKTWRPTKADLLWAERRALALCAVTPQNVDPRYADLLHIETYTRDERMGWAIHHWDDHGQRPVREAPRNRHQLAGWFSRHLFLEGVR